MTKLVTFSFNTSIANNVYVGMIVGKLSGTLENVYAIGTLTSTSLKASYVGGLVGFNNGTVINSYSDVNIVATSKGSNCFAAGLIGYNNENVSGCFVHGNVSAKGYLESYSFASGLIAAEGETSKVTSCFRYNGQIITKCSSISTSFTNIGTESTLDNIISYCKTNWDNTIWSFEKTLPVFKR